MNDIDNSHLLCQHRWLRANCSTCTARRELDPGYALIWVSDIGYAGTEQDRYYVTAEAAMADATDGVTWERRGNEWRSSRSTYGDIFFVTPAR